MTPDASNPARAAAPEISVVIPHLGQPALLGRCLRALTDQRDAPPFEVLVVDNGSPEPPEAVCAASGARLLHEPTPGPGPARNRGAAAAKGAILAFTDADCLVDPGWLSVIARRFRNDGDAPIIGGDVRIALADPEAMTAVEAYESVYGFRTRLYIERDHYPATLNMAVRRKVFEAVGPFGGIEVAEDADWGRRAHTMGYAMVYAPEMRVLHPARASYAELRRKWDRHVSHFYEEARGGPLWRLRWLAKAGATALSPGAELVTILRSDRLSGWRQRMLAFRTLTRIRLHRARRMISLGLGADPARLSDGWRRNRDAPDG